MSQDLVNEVIDPILEDVEKILAVLSPDCRRTVQALLMTEQFRSREIQILVGATPFTL